MMRILPILLLAVSLSACANVQNAWNAVTGATVSPQAVYLARNIFDGFERTARNYLVLCHQSPSSVVCSKKAEVDIAAAVRSGISARNDLTAFMKAHPDALGAQGVFDAMKAATDELKKVLQEYGVKS